MRRATWRRGAALTAVPLLLVSGCGLLPGSAERIPEGVSEVPALVETEPVRNPDDAADDPAIWIHPEDASRSTVIGTDKLGALAVYDLTGDELHRYDDGEHNNVDVRYGFPVDGTPTDLVVSSDRASETLRIYAVDPTTRGLTDLTGDTGVPIEPYGLCLYAPRPADRLYAFVTDVESGLQQWELVPQDDGTFDARHVRDLPMETQAEGCVADDAGGLVYAAEQSVGIWRYAADPDADPDEELLVRTVEEGGDHLESDVEGLAIYHAAEGPLYLLASSQGNNTFVVYELEPFTYVGRFAVGAGEVDGATETDGIEVTNVSLGDPFDAGLFVAQDGHPETETQNFKLVAWEAIAEQLDLVVDTTWSPRDAS
jgi:myo-inositol-hexaphosphate 3-phosphohydrolase